MTYEEWIGEVDPEEVSIIFAVAVPLETLGMYQHVGKEFATRYVLQWFEGKHRLEPRYKNAVFCAEVIRLHDYGILDNPPDDVTPADYQQWVIMKELPMVTMWRRA
jgi:hypothetical protein